MPFVISWVLVSGRRGPLIELYDHWEHAASINELSLNLLPAKFLAAYRRCTDPAIYPVSLGSGGIDCLL